jgi:hypothetical protein
MPEMNFQPELVHETLLGDYISPIEFKVRVLECIAEHGPIEFDALKQRVVEATPEITEHPKLEVSEALLADSVQQLERLDVGVYSEPDGKLAYFSETLF